jgi:hypothetical protein
MILPLLRPREHREHRRLIADLTLPPLHAPQAPSAKDRGLIAAVGATVVMSLLMPLDVVVKRLQVQGCPGHPVLYRGPVDAFMSIARKEGVGELRPGQPHVCVCIYMCVQICAKRPQSEHIVTSRPPPRVSG